MDKHLNYNNHLYSYRDPQSYDQLVDYLSKGKNRSKTTDRPIANNTRVIRRSPQSIAIRLHATDVITFFENGNIQLNSDGWKTVTTKDRMSRFLPSGINVYSLTFVWYVRFNQKQYLYQDGILFTHDGFVLDSENNLIPEHSESIEKQKRSQLRKINLFIRNGLKRLRAGEITPSEGDCWICSMKRTDGDSMEGDNKYSCIQSHIDENYFHFSLIMNAVKSECYDPEGHFGNPKMTYGLAPIDKHNLSVWANSNCGHKVFAEDMTIRRLQKVLKQFITKQLNF